MGDQKVVDGSRMDAEVVPPLDDESDAPMPYYTTERGAPWLPPSPSAIPLPRGVHRLRSTDYPDYWHMEIWTAAGVLLACCYIHQSTYDEWREYYHAALEKADPQPDQRPLLRVI